MNSDIIEHYKYLLDRFKENERDAALDGLIAASDKSNIKNAESFLYQAMKNRVKNYHRDIQRSTMKPEMEPIEKSVEITKPARSGRAAQQVIVDFPKFYNTWLFDHHREESFRARQEAEKEWDALRVYKQRKIDPLEGAFELDAPAYEDNGETFDVEGDFLNPEESLLIEEERQELISLSGLKSDKLKRYMYRFIPAGLEIGSEEIRTAYKKSLLAIIANYKDWKDVFLFTDINLICKLAGLDTNFVCNKLMPREAAQGLKELTRL